MIVLLNQHVAKAWAGNEAWPHGVGEQGLKKLTFGLFCTEVPRMLILDTNAWAQQQFSACQLGDQRRTRRLVRLAEQVVSHPAGGFPEQTETWADLKAAYRLLDRTEVTFESVAEVHWQQTRRRSAGRYLVLGDTTELDFGIHRDIPELGPTGNGGGWGFLLHSGLLVAAEGEEIFGLAGQTIHYRKAAPRKENSTQRLERERESKVWGDVIDAVGRPADGAELVHVLDRGADNFEVYCHCLKQETDWVVRVTQKGRNILTPDDEQVPLKAYVDTLPVSGTYELFLRARPGQAARTAKLQVRHGALEVAAPAHRSSYVKRINPDPIEMHVVAVHEVDANPGVEPIEWILLTSLVVEDFEDAWVIIGYYEKRWLIEEWHKALKTGCRVTERQLKAKHRLETMVGLLSVVSVRLLQLKAAARTQPDRPAHRMIPTRWITLLAAARKNLKVKSLTVGEFYRELAKLGGFIGRRSDGEPGWITIWRGWQKLYLLVRGAELASEIQ
jgi:Transposase DNA-binding/Transposase Tn5 dimerisation domain